MDDLISRQEATSIPILPKEHRKIFKSIDDAFETGWNEALSCVNMLPSAQPDLSGYSDKLWRAAYERGKAEAQPQWIPCSERMPKESGQYLITVKYEHVDGYEDIYAEHGDWDGEKWDMFCFGHCGKAEDIVAWQPLPAPYKGGDSE